MSLNTSRTSEALNKGQALIAEIEAGREEIENLKWVASNPDEFLSIRELALDKLCQMAAESKDIYSLVRNAVHAEIGKTALKIVNTETALTEYLTYQSGNKGNKKRHVRNVELILRHFLAFAKVLTLADISGTHVEQYLGSISHLSAKTRKDRRGMIAAWLNWAKKVRKYVAENVAEAVAAPRVSAKDVAYHSFEELGRIFHAAHGHDKRDLILFALYSGLRSGEIGRVASEDIDLTGRAIRVRGTKTGVNRNVPLMDELLPVLTRLPKQGKLFPFSMTSGSTMRSLREVWSKANLSGETGLQILRHTWVSHLLLAGIDPYKVARYAGHDYAVQQKHYAGIKLGDKTWRMTSEMHGIGKASDGPSVGYFMVQGFDFETSKDKVELWKIMQREANSK